MNLDSGTPLPGQTFRFIVGSADEAVKMIHEKLGGEARVISVKQIGSTGFRGLFRSPRLEVIAEVTGPASTLIETFAPVSPMEEEIGKEPAPASPAPVPNSRLKTTAPGDALERILLRSGISEHLLMRLRRSPSWQRISSRPFREGLLEAVGLLRAEWGQRAELPMGKRVAFFGTPGSGTTTALCKALTVDVFIREQEAVVLKLDGDQPNPTEGLAMYCEALNVPLLRSADDLDASDARVYLDLAGIGVQDQSGWRGLSSLLSEFYVDTRVLVVNAAYEASLIRTIFDRAREAGATHVIFTHLDEIQHWGKLWEPLLEGGLNPLFFSRGQNISGEVGDNMLEMLVEKTFGVRR